MEPVGNEESRNEGAGRETIRVYAEARELKVTVLEKSLNVGF